MVVESHAEYARAVARENDALPARPLHHVGDPERRVAGIRLATEPTLSYARAWQSTRSDARREQRSGDALVPRQCEQRQGAAERKLRPRVDGTLYAGARKL